MTTETQPKYSALDYLRMIAEGYEIIESDGSRMTIQCPDDEGPQELIVDVDALAKAEKS